MACSRCSQFTGWFDYADGGPVINQLLDENLNVVETVNMGNGFQSESHDFQLLPNGHVLMLGYYTTLADLRAVVSNAPPLAEVSGSVIQELDGNRNVIWQWRSWDHFNWNQFSDWGAASASGIISGLVCEYRSLGSAGWQSARWHGEGTNEN